MFQKLGEKFRRFMYGRYGSDQLNVFLLILGVVLCLLGSFSRLYYLGLIAYVPLIWAIFRMYSRNLEKRRRENRRFTQFFCTAAGPAESLFLLPPLPSAGPRPPGQGQNRH